MADGLLCDFLKTIQIPPNGFRNGDMGDDQSPNSAQEGVPVYILSRTPPLPSPYPKNDKPTR